MPSPDSAKSWSGSIGNHLSEVEPAGEVAVYGAQQLVDGAAAMVPGDVGVQIEPQALDPVLVGAVRRQKVEPQLGAVVAEPGLGQAALVDDVVVENQMDATGPAVGVQQRAQQVEEQPARLAVAGDVDQPLVGLIVGTGQMTLLVLPRSHDLT